MPETVNQRTGEVEEVTEGIYVPGVKIQANVTNLARLQLTGLEFRVLFAIYSQLSRHGGVVAHTTIARVAEALDKSHQGVQRIFDSLKQKKVITRASNGIWIINPRLGFAGTYRDWSHEYLNGPEPEYATNSNGLDGKKFPREYIRSSDAWGAK